MKSASFGKDFNFLVGCVQGSRVRSSSNDGWSSRSEYRTVFVATYFIDKVSTDSSGANKNNVAALTFCYKNSSQQIQPFAKSWSEWCPHSSPKLLQQGAGPIKAMSVKAAAVSLRGSSQRQRVLEIESEPQLHSQPGNASEDGKVSTQRKHRSERCRRPVLHRQSMQSSNSVIDETRMTPGNYKVNAIYSGGFYAPATHTYCLFSRSYLFLYDVLSQTAFALLWFSTKHRGKYMVRSALHHFHTISLGILGGKANVIFLWSNFHRKSSQSQVQSFWPGPVISPTVSPTIKQVLHIYILLRSTYIHIYIIAMIVIIIVILIFTIIIVIVMMFLNGVVCSDISLGFRYSEKRNKQIRLFFSGLTSNLKGTRWTVTGQR